MNRTRNLKWIVLAIFLIGSIVVAQDFQRRYGGRRYGSDYEERGGVP